jgi:type I restriction-modification system DNA methylase subunit
MKQLPPNKRFEQSLLELSRTQSLWTVFNDFLDFSLLFIRWWAQKDSDYAELEKRYTNQRQVELMVSAYMAMADIAENGGSGFKDPFGDFYMEYLSNDRNGQFFTPETVCDMIARIQIGPTLPENATAGDPCCGSGRLLLSAAKINRKAIFYAADIDLACCKMTVLNFLLNTICGEVAWMNTLTQEHWKAWRINKVMGSNGFYVPYYQEIQFDQSHVVAKLGNELFNKEQIKSPIKSKNSNKWKQKQTNQLILNFD